MNKKKSRSILNRELNFGKLNLKEKATIAQNISIMLKAGLTITESLDVIIEREKGRVKQMFVDIQGALVSGNKISSAFARYPKVFDGFFTSSIRTGEASGNLEQVFSQLGEYYEKKLELKKKIKSAMTYPMIVLILSFAMGIGLSIFVLPKITPIFSGLNIKLPWTTRMLIYISQTMEENGLWIVLGFIFFISLFIWLMKARFMQPITHNLYLKIPVINSITSHKNIAQISQTLSTLIKSGMGLDEALETTSKSTSNFYYRNSLRRVQTDIAKGGRISESFSVFPHLYPTLAISLIRVGEKSGNLEESFSNIGQVYSREVDNATKNLSTILEPALLIVIGLVVGLLAISIITPIYTITGNVYR